MTEINKTFVNCAQNVLGYLARIQRIQSARLMPCVPFAYLLTYFCHFLPKTFLGFVLHIAEYRIDLFYVYGIDKIAYRHLQKLQTFCIAWPDRLH